MSAIVLLGAALLDYLVGDPWGWLHPVQVMGWGITTYTQLAFRWIKRPVFLKLAGIGLTIAIVGGSGTIAWLIVHVANLLHPIAGMIVSIVMVASCLAGRSLRDAAEDVLKPLAMGDVEKARSQLRLYVGRDTDRLSESDIYRAVFETVAENSVDGVTAPLFYALLGAFLPIGSAPIAIAYKAASTLDSMVGYKTEPYKDIGWFSAKTDDVLTWLPCRLTVLTLGSLSGKPLTVWRQCRQDAPQDPSPNSGWSEAVYAAALDVQVGGVNHYKGVEKFKPLLGKASRSIDAERIRAALQLTRICSLTWIAIVVFGLLRWTM